MVLDCMSRVRLPWWVSLVNHPKSEAMVDEPHLRQLLRSSTFLKLLADKENRHNSDDEGANIENIGSRSVLGL